MSIVNFYFVCKICTHSHGVLSLSNNSSIIGSSNCGGVLHWHERSAMDGFTLSEKIWEDFAGSLAGGEPVD